jgi:hypothetical protein
LTPEASTPPPGLFRRPERLLPVACIAAAGLLFASEFMTIFDLTPEGGTVLCAQNAASRHHFALGVIAIFAVIAVIVAVVAASKPAALAAGAAGIVALLLFLTIDLPKANNVGTLGGCTPTTAGSFFDAKAIPQAGFWLEMIGALGLALSGAALATMSPEQLETLRPGRRRPRDAKRSGEPPKPQRTTEPREATREKRAAAGRRRT